MAANAKLPDCEYEVQNFSINLPQKILSLKILVSIPPKKKSSKVWLKFVKFQIFYSDFYLYRNKENNLKKTIFEAIKTIKIKFTLIKS